MGYLYQAEVDFLKLTQLLDLQELPIPGQSLNE
jgi:hypothetical protein